MWLRHAVKLLLATILFSACSPSDRQQVDKLNLLSYAYHYRSLDSLKHYCDELSEKGHSGLLTDDQLAECRNNEAFYWIAKMKYDVAESCLNEIPQLTDNQIELLIGYVQQMRLCQRRSRNKDFYDYRERAITCQQRINEERDLLSEHQQRRLLYAETELAIVTSTYFYYIGLEQQSIDALMAIDADDVKQDTAQFLNYLYNVGAGGILTNGSAADIYQQEMDCLLRCFQISQRGNYPYFKANALEAIAEHLTTAQPDEELSDRGLAMVNPEGLQDCYELAVWVAEESLMLFQDYGDVYQIAGAYRTLASCYRAQGDYERALQHLELALSDTLINQAPDLVASIREQLSVAYAAVDDKAASDYNRNLYLDLQEQTRQDRQLEARAGQLDRAVTQLNWILVAVGITIVLLLFLLWFFRYKNRRQRTESPLDELIDERREQLAISRQHIEEGERRHLEQRAKISLVNSLLPLIDRMVYSIKRSQLSNGQTGQSSNDQLAYVCELIDQMNADNEVLTHWIQLQQGQLSLRIESFPLQPLFDMVARSRKSFQMKDVELRVEPTEAVVKADRILTLFMLNTLADNARKFTDEGHVDISATQTDDYVEVSVSDTGIGMDEEKLAHVFDRKVIVDDAAPQSSHGFGLLNCKGIIEKYRKLSQLFHVCTLQAESQQGRGSRFFFRLPIGRALGTLGPLGLLGLLGMMSLMPLSAIAQTGNSPLARAAVYADSAYFCNINGNYERTLLFADSCRECLNDLYLQQHPQGSDLMLREGDTSLTPPEILWFHDSLPTNYNLILDIRNESAVAALALHQWQLYNYNNRIYTQLFKELSADNTLADYCRKMQQTKTNRMIAVVLLIMALLAIFPAYYFYYLRPRINARFKAERLRRDDLTLLDDDLRRADMEVANLHVSNAVLDNCLSTLKHETMYYPSRIRQLIAQGDVESVNEVVSYYRDLYNMLSLQAMSQVERVKLHLKAIATTDLQLPPFDTPILGDETLLRYLFDILRKQAGQSQLNATVSLRGDSYVEVVIDGTEWMPDGELFTPAINYIPYLLCRQIVRDHGEATNRRACSIKAEQTENGNKTIIIILPAWKSSK